MTVLLAQSNNSRAPQ